MSNAPGTYRFGITVVTANSVNLRPAGVGVDIVIRYITRAGVRVETRYRLFGVIVELMQGESKEDRNLCPTFRSWNLERLTTRVTKGN